MDHPGAEQAGAGRPRGDEAPGTVVQEDAPPSPEPVEAAEPAGPGEPGGATETLRPPVGEPRANRLHRPDDGDSRTDGHGPAGGRRASRALWAGLILSVLIALATSLLAADAVADRNRERRDRQEVEEVAGRLATALSTYDYRSFDATKARVLGLSTGAFASEYERAVAALASLIDQTKATSEATAGDVFVGNLGDGKASAIVVIEIRANGVGGPRVSVDNYVDLSLVKVEGEWKVDGVRNLNLGVSGGGAATPPSTRPATPGATTAPSAPSAP